MEININLDKLSIPDTLYFLDKLKFDTFFVMCKKFKGEDYPYVFEDMNDLYQLQHLGFIKITSDEGDFELLEKSEELFGKKLDSLTELANKLIEIYPQGVKSGGYPVRGSNVDVTDKLRKFFKKHKYTQEQVTQATEKYIERKRNEGWAYIQGLIYFIEKNGSSNLAAEIDGMKGDDYGTGEDWTRNVK